MLVSEVVTVHWDAAIKSRRLSWWQDFGEMPEIPLLCKPTLFKIWFQRVDFVFTSYRVKIRCSSVLVSLSYLSGLWDVVLTYIWAVITNPSSNHAFLPLATLPSKARLESLKRCHLAIWNLTLNKQINHWLPQWWKHTQLPTSVRTRPSFFSWTGAYCTCLSLLWENKCQLHSHSDLIAHQASNHKSVLVWATIGGLSSVCTFCFLC